MLKEYYIFIKNNNILYFKVFVINYLVNFFEFFINIFI